MTETPPFDEALAEFLHWIGVEGMSADLVWVFREDVTNHRRKYWIRTPQRPGNFELSRRYFEFGRRRGLGVTLEVVGRVDGRTACLVWVPEDEEDASYAMQGALKLMFPMNRSDARPVRSRLMWIALKALNRWRRRDGHSASLRPREWVAALTSTPRDVVR